MSIHNTCFADKSRAQRDGCISVRADYFLTLLLLNTTCPVLANSEDPDQLAGF